MEKEKVIDIKEKYSHEIADIADILQQLKDGRCYELTHVQSDGYISTNVDKLKRELNELFTKIEYGEPSVIEVFAQQVKEKDL